MTAFEMVQTAIAGVSALSFFVDVCIVDLLGNVFKE